jgi:hypothetical protein
VPAGLDAEAATIPRQQSQFTLMRESAILRQFLKHLMKTCKVNTKKSASLYSRKNHKTFGGMREIFLAKIYPPNSY